MSRPKPTIMLEWTNSKNYNTEQILKAKLISLGDGVKHCSSVKFKKVLIKKFKFAI